jgi:hypothetical protein
MGQPARTLDSAAFARAEVATADVARRRTLARAAAVRAIRLVEEKLTLALSQDVLRGVANLCAIDGEVFHGVRVYGSPRFGIDSYLASDGHECFVIDKHGHLVMVRQGRPCTSRPVRDDELQAQDLEAVTAAVASALARHVQRAERTAASYERAEALSQRIARALY